MYLSQTCVFRAQLNPRDICIAMCVDTGTGKEPQSGDEEMPGTRLVDIC